MILTADIHAFCESKFSIVADRAHLAKEIITTTVLANSANISR